MRARPPAPAIARAIAAATGGAGPSARGAFVTGYAPLDGRSVPRGSVGVQAPDIEVKLVDAAGREHHSDGELLIRSPYVCLGYHNQPEVTAARLENGV